MARNRLRDLQVREVSFVDKGAVREVGEDGEPISGKPMRFLLWKDEDGCGDCDPDALEKAQLSTSERDALPDSAFADPGNRKYPIRHKDGSWDPAHIRNALSRCADPQNTCGPQVKARIQAAARGAGIGDDVNKKEDTELVDAQEALAVVLKAAQRGQLNDEQRAALANLTDEASPEQGGVLSGLLKDESMPDAVRTYLESVESRLGKLAKADSGAAEDEEEGDELATLLKQEGIVPRVRELLQKREEEARVAKAELEKLRLESAQNAARAELEKAESTVANLRFLGLDQEGTTELAKALFLLRREDADAAAAFEGVLKAQNRKAQTSALWQEIGLSSATGGQATAQAELETRAVELRKADSKLSLDAARAQVLVEDQALAQRLDDEGIRAS